MLRVRTLWTGVAGTPWYTNMYFEGLNSADALAVSGRVNTWLNAVRAYVATGIKAEISPEVFQIDPADATVEGIYTVPTAGYFGNSAGEMLPPANQVNIRLLSSGIVDNRRVRGHIYLPGTTEANALSGVTDSVIRNALNAATTTLIGVAPGQQMAVWNRPRIFNPPVQPLPARAGQIFIATSASTQNNYSVLRSRRD